MMMTVQNKTQTLFQMSLAFAFIGDRSLLVVVNETFYIKGREIFPILVIKKWKQELVYYMPTVTITCSRPYVLFVSNILVQAGRPRGNKINTE